MEQQVARRRHGRVNRAGDLVKPAELGWAGRLIEAIHASDPIPTVHDSRPPRSRKPTARTRPPMSATISRAWRAAAAIGAIVTTRKMADVESGAPTLCGSIGVRAEL
jgi:hypothetical protein